MPAHFLLGEQFGICMQTGLSLPSIIPLMVPAAAAAALALRREEGCGGPTGGIICFLSNEKTKGLGSIGAR